MGFAIQPLLSPFKIKTPHGSCDFQLKEYQVFLAGVFEGKRLKLKKCISLQEIDFFCYGVLFLCYAKGALLFSVL